jgi:endonuclease YncB( thermonuclease family)
VKPLGSNIVKYLQVPQLFSCILAENPPFHLMQKFNFLFFTIAILFQCQESAITGKVVKVADGDTFTMLTDQNEQIRIRLHGIDAPEKSQDFSQVSKNHLTELVMSKPVRVYTKKRDQYGRVVAIVYVGDQVVNEAMLRAGLAWHFTEYDSNPEWEEMESSARRSRIGIWSHERPVPPWQFRKEKRKRRQH